MTEQIHFNELCDMYDEMLDETTGDIHIGNLTYSASQVLKNTDPVAYKIGRNEYADMLVEDGYCVEVDMDVWEGEEDD